MNRACCCARACPAASAESSQITQARVCAANEELGKTFSTRHAAATDSALAPRSLSRSAPSLRRRLSLPLRRGVRRLKSDGRPLSPDVA
eukprot:5098456-Pleurochrysis_carterae.AAC.1